MKYTSIRPGQEWRDNNGELIQAHGGSVLFHDGKYYWYGENKEKSISEKIIWHWGVRLYSSTDLYNWTDEGIICMPEPDDITSPLHPNSKMDRPHILYNEMTKKFVLWMKVMGEKIWGGKDKQYMTVAVSDSIKGPFKIINRMLHPCGMDSGDFDLFVDNGKGYIIFERVHKDMIVMELTDDYMDVTDKYSVHFPRKCPPYVREAPAVFKKDGMLYMFTSGTTAKFPNPSEVAVSKDIHGEWKELGNPHINDIKNTSFDSQISCVFKVQDSDMYIAMADRWLMDLPEDMPDIQAIYECMFDDTIESEYRGYDVNSLTSKNTSIARYVWLPVEFVNGVPMIRWYNEWRIDDITK